MAHYRARAISSYRKRVGVKFRIIYINHELVDSFLTVNDCY